MARSTFEGVAIRGIAGAVPKTRFSMLTGHRICTAEESKKIVDLTGVYEYRKATSAVCSSDLCQRAAESLLSGLGVNPTTIDAILFVTMTPDYRVPSTAGILQDRIGASRATVAFDINMGCSGYVVGLYNACALLAGAGLKRVLLLAGDTQTKLCCERDKSVVFLLGDGGTATLLEAQGGVDSVTLELMTDGSRFKSLYIPAGGFRQPSSDATREVKARPDGGLRSDDDLFMESMEIFKFSADVVKTIQGFLDSRSLSHEHFDVLLLSQANKFTNDRIARKLKFPAEKVPYSLRSFGNTGSASIPLTVVTNSDRFAGKESVRSILCGFGVGLSWGVADVTFSGLLCPPIEEC